MVIVAHVINTQKLSTFLWIVAVMFHYDNWGPTACVYLALHGSYGFCWFFIKEMAFPNKRFYEDSVSLPELLILGPILFFPGYWSIPVLALRQKEEASPPLLVASTMVYVFGLVIMMVSDCQTYWLLKERPGRLITEGMNRYIRHPNYTGEILLYASFCLLARHWGAWMALGVGWLAFMLPANIKKEKSLSRYPAWKEYHAQSGFYLPYIPAFLAGSRLDRKLLDKPKVPEKPKVLPELVLTEHSIGRD